MMSRPLTTVAVLFLAATATVAMGQTTTQAPATTSPTTGPAATTQETMKNDLNDASYGIGYSMGQQLAQAPFKLDVDRIVEGLRDSVGGKAAAVPEPQLRAAMQRLQEQAATAGEANAKAQGAANAEAGEAFRAANAKKPGVTTTASGLQIEKTTEGDGASPKPTDTVKVHYTGTLIDGTKFDSSVDRGEPISFPLNGVIPGWTEGLQLMKVGGKAKLVIPPALGYGASGQGPIPPNATLVFDVELLGIESK
ncbi:MAG TPA: FKBP-type peptidyl-prolyl cis-trans isomerase [Tepidisphaeraceae bacterium]|jgi:FKBP-type peptidyl-prolyl cis-trans isomerase|nr:FKBP-type peptidyl-prolyl cis-trans isomerase [Tepidisphaeraceae bacterium]